jgi:hypothetical protein
MMAVSWSFMGGYGCQTSEAVWERDAIRQEGLDEWRLSARKRRLASVAENLQASRMKRLWLVFLFCVVTGATVIAQDPMKLREGEMMGCHLGKATCVIFLTTKQPDKNVFEGELRLGPNQKDRVQIEQFDNGSLKITWYLSGAKQGETQVIYTYPPTLKTTRGTTYATFTFQTDGALGAKGIKGDVDMQVAK